MRFFLGNGEAMMERPNLSFKFLVFLALSVSSCGRQGGQKGACTLGSMQATDSMKALPSVGGFIWRKLYKDDGITPSDGVKICTAAFEFRKQGSKYSVDIATALSTRCFSYDQTASLVLKLYWNGSYFDIPVSVDSFKNKIAAVRAAGDLGESGTVVSSFLAQTFDPLYLYKAVEEIRLLSDDKRPKGICSDAEYSDQGCRDYLSVFTHRVELPENLSSSLRKVIDETIDFQAKINKKIRPPVKKIMDELKVTRLERTTLARKHNIGFSAYLLSECGKKEFSRETILSISSKEIFESVCSNKEKVKSIVDKYIKLDGKNSFEVLASINKDAKKATEELESKIRANALAEEELLQSLFKEIQKDTGLSEGSFPTLLSYASNHLKTARPEPEKISYAAIPVTSKLPQIKGSSVSVKNARVFYVDGLLERANGKEEDKGLVNMGLREQQGQSLILAQSFPLVVLPSQSKESDTSALPSLPRFSEQDPEEGQKDVAGPVTKPPPVTVATPKPRGNGEGNRVIVQVPVQPGPTAPTNTAVGEQPPTTSGRGPKPGGAPNVEPFVTTPQSPSGTQQTTEANPMAPGSSARPQAGAAESSAPSEQMEIESPQVADRGC